jgi:hypothetical protein
MDPVEFVHVTPAELSPPETRPVTVAAVELKLGRVLPYTTLPVNAVTNK